jgi:hypothetical protein
MVAKILRFTVPKSSELSTWVEEHVAVSSGGGREPRLLRINGVPHPDQDPKGVFVFDHGIKYRVPRPYLQLSYEMTPIQVPEWWCPNLEHNTPGNWFSLRIGPFPNGAFADIPIRQYSRMRRPDVFCSCGYTSGRHGRRRQGEPPFIEEETGEALCFICRACLYPRDVYKERIVLFSRNTPGRKPNGQGHCVHCGYRASSPIHNAQAMKGSPAWHEYAPEGPQQ